MIYTVILNSNLRTSGSVGNAMYNFDWASALEPGEYNMSWAITTGNVTITDGTALLVSAELGQTGAYICSAINTSAQSTNIIGTLISNEVGSSFFYGDRNSNGSLRLKRPTSNEFSVKLLSCDAVPLEITTVANYVLNLSFDKV